MGEKRGPKPREKEGALCVGLATKVRADEAEAFAALAKDNGMSKADLLRILVRDYIESAETIEASDGQI